MVKQAGSASKTRRGHSASRQNGLAIDMGPANYLFLRVIAPDSFLPCFKLFFAIEILRALASPRRDSGADCMRAFLAPINDQFNGADVSRKKERLSPGGGRQPHWGLRAEKNCESFSVCRCAYSVRILATTDKFFACDSFFPFFSTVPVFAIESLPVRCGPTSSPQALKRSKHSTRQTGELQAGLAPCESDTYGLRPAGKGFRQAVGGEILTLRGTSCRWTRGGERSGRDGEGSTKKKGHPNCRWPMRSAPARTNHYRSVMPRKLVTLSRLLAAASFLPFFGVFLAIAASPNGYKMPVPFSLWSLHAGLQIRGRLTAQLGLKIKKLARCCP